MLTQMNKWIDLLNSLIINMSVIIGSTLSFYFIYLRKQTTQNRRYFSFNLEHFPHVLGKPKQVLIGMLFGFLSIVLSLNRTILVGPIPQIDMRYIFIYFSVTFGNPLTGLATTLTIILLKSIAFIMGIGFITTTDYINHMLLTVLLFVVSIYIQKINGSVWKRHVSFLISFLTIKFFSILFIFPILLTSPYYWRFVEYAILFSSVFLITTYIVCTSISVSKSFNVYRLSATFDTDTQLYNKESFHLFLEYLENFQLTTHTSELAISLIDIDNFKQINDRYGHINGDKALKHLSDLLKKHLIANKDFAFRVGGDEFAIMFTHCSHQETTEKVTAILEELRSVPVLLDSHPYFLHISMGVNYLTFPKSHEKTIPFDKAVLATDRLLYQAKNQGKNQVVNGHNDY